MHCSNGSWNALLERLVEWAEEYGFVLDGDSVDFESGRKDDFIASLDNVFADWGKKTEIKDGKLESIYWHSSRSCSILARMQ